MLFVGPRFPAVLQNARGRAALSGRRKGGFPCSTSKCRITSQTSTGSDSQGGIQVVTYEDDGTRVVPVPLFVTATQQQLITGVYGILDGYRELVYVGMSRDVTASIVAHYENHDEDVVYVKVMTFQELALPEMKRVAEAWVLDNEVTPKGNIEEWHEHDAELAAQAKETEIDMPSSQGPIISPFADDPYASSQSVETMPFTTANVDLALDEVRPFLIADGGNVSVDYVNLDSGKVGLRLEGACHSCSSATTTMRLGIEKALRKKFGENLGEVVAVNKVAPEDEPVLAVCERALDTIRDTLRGLGGDVSIVEVDEDEVVLSFSGPSNLKFGIEKTILEKAPTIEIVTFE